MSLHRADVLGGRAAIVGIGATEFSKDSGRSELKLASRPSTPRWTTPGSVHRMWTDSSPSPWTPTPRSPSPRPPASVS